MIIFRYLFIIIFITFIFNIILYFVSVFSKEITVNKVYDIRRTLMFEDSNNNSYIVSNVWYLGRFNSMEEWNKLEVGKKYRIKGFGYRIGFLGMYPRIYDINPI